MATFSYPARSVIRLEGVEDFRAAMNEAGVLAGRALGSALFQWANNTIAAAKEITPVDTGTLRASGGVDLPRFTRQRVEVILGFGGAAAHYAVPVHENLGQFHRVGQAKFLETPVLERAPELPIDLARRMRAELNRIRRRRR